MTDLSNQAVFVRDFDLQNPPASWPKWWHDNGISDVWLQAHSQDTVVSADALKTWAQAAASVGLRVCLWGSNGPDPIGDVHRILGAFSVLKTAGIPVRAVVAEVERYVRPTSDDTLSAQYVAAFRGEPAFHWMPLGVCVQADCAATMSTKRGLDFGSWFNGRAFLVPECYWNQAEGLNPAACLDLQVQQGWPLDRIKPVFGVWGNAGNADKRALDYLDNVAGRALSGFSWYAGLTLTEDDLRITDIMHRLGLG